MKKQNFRVEEVIRDSLSILKRQGFQHAINGQLTPFFRGLAQFSQSKFGGEYSIDIGEAYIQSLRDRKIPLSTGYIQANIVAIQLANRVMEADIDWHPPAKPSLEYEDSAYRDKAEEYSEYLRNSGKTKSDVRSRMHAVTRFLRFADESGVSQLNDITAMLIYKAFEKASDKEGFRNRVGAFFRYAHRHGLTECDFSIFIPSVSRRTPVPTVYTPDEIERIIETAAESKKSGKRNKAIVVIAARLGLRACDIANLRFKNINREADMIEITQVKTKEKLALPLLPEIFEAIYDYIKNERPVSDSDMIFLYSNTLYKGAIQPNTISSIISKVIGSSGIDIAGRKHGPHSLRSSLATALLNEGYNHGEVQMALGHNSPESVKFYVKTEVEKLRDYALSVPAPNGIFAKKLSVECGI